MFTENANKIFNRVIEDYHCFDDVDHKFENPYPAGSLDALLYEKNLVSIEELMIKLNFADFIRRFERENMNIISFGENIDYQKKIDTIKERLMDYAREIAPKQQQSNEPIKE